MDVNYTCGDEKKRARMINILFYSYKYEMGQIKHSSLVSILVVSSLIHGLSCYVQTQVNFD